MNAFPRHLLLGLALATLALAMPAKATDLADVPMAVKNRVKPNIMFALDNSGSMSWPFMPDGTFGSRNKACFKNSVYNQQYYDPNTVYTPPVKADGTSFGNQSFSNAAYNGLNPYSSSNPAGTWFRLKTDSFSTRRGSANLNTEFQSFYDDRWGYYLCWVLQWNGSAWVWVNICDNPGAAYYYRWNGSCGAAPTPGQCHANSCYTKITVSSTSGPGTVDLNGDGVIDAQDKDERANFANWFSYYRTRHQAMASSLSLAFSVLDDRYRVGFSTINNNWGWPNTSGANFIATQDFTNSQKSAWYSRLFSIDPRGGTPLRNALRAAGEYYRTGTFPGTSSSDPVQYSCQPNYTILSTDGYWNGSFSAVGNQDQGPIPAIPEPIAVDAAHPDPVSGTALVTGANPWPRPFYEGAASGCTIPGAYTTTGASYSCNGAANTLADVAMYYWVTDLRAGMSNNVAPNSADPATWQHMTTFTVGLGVDGVLPFNATTLSLLKNGTIPGWPTPGANSQANVDDLWHAAINGHGQYFSAKDPATLRTSLINAVNEIVGRTGAAAAVTVSNPFLSATDNAAFESKYNSGTWSGDLMSYPLDLSTGQPNHANPNWPSSAQAQLDAKLWTTRNIATYNGTSGVPFTPTGLGATLTAKLNTPYSPPGTSDAANVINFLRGDRSLEGSSYRVRTHVLGDIVNAEGVYVAAPRFNFADAGYAAYKSAQASRLPVIYQPANDGMIHAFNAASGGGNELWAYVPGLLFDVPLDPGFYPNTSSLVNLSRANGFEHRYYVDGTPVAGDVDFNNTQGSSGSPDWRTILVGGLGKGGRGYYALDVTNPAASSDAAVAAKVLWEFPNAATPASVKKNIGYSYGKPVIVKTQAAGWVVLVTSGYNNGTDTGGTGEGYLFVLNAKTGALIKAISTGVGSPTDPSGLAQISAYVQYPDVDATTDFVYGTDLKGNVWRFDLSGNGVGSWNVKKLATLVDGNGNPQPITSAPELGELTGLGKRMVYVATGQYLGDSDIPQVTGTVQTQSVYALVDDLSNNPLISPLRANLQQQPTYSPAGATSVTITGNTVDYATKKGWYYDFSNSASTSPSTRGQRVFTDPVLAYGKLIVTANTPNADPCTPGGTSMLYSFDYAFNPITVPGSTLNVTAAVLGNSLASRATVVVTNSGQAKALTRQSDDTTVVSDVGNIGGTGSLRRIMWREIVNE